VSAEALKAYVITYRIKIRRKWHVYAIAGADRDTAEMVWENVKGQALRESWDYELLYKSDDDGQEIVGTRTATAVLVPAPTTMPALRKIVVGALRSDSDLRDEGIRRAHEIVIAHGKTLGRHARCGGLGMVIGLTGQVEPCGCRPNGVEHGCPDCAENDVDCLTFLDDDTVRCLTCGKEYRP